MRETLAALFFLALISSVAISAADKATGANGAAVTEKTVMTTAPTSQLEIRRHRFRNYGKLAFDRLVIEFTEHGDRKIHEVKGAVAPNGRETTFEVKGISLVGGIPESAINDSFLRKSKFMSAININPDSAGDGFTVRSLAKDTNLAWDAFFLESPLRLVIDVFPKASPRSQGREVANMKPGRKPTAVAAAVAAKGTPTILCFPVNSRVLATINFEGEVALVQPQDNDVAPIVELKNDNVACYPVSAALKPSISFTNNVELVPGVGLKPAASKPISAPVIMAKPPAPTPKPQQAAVVNAPEDMFDDLDLFSMPTKEDKDAPPPKAQQSQRVPSSPPTVKDTSIKTMPPPPPIPGIGGLLPSLKK